MILFYTPLAWNHVATIKTKRKLLGQPVNNYDMNILSLTSNNVTVMETKYPNVPIYNLLCKPNILVLRNDEKTLLRGVSHIVRCDVITIHESYGDRILKILDSFYLQH